MKKILRSTTAIVSSIFGKAEVAPSRRVRRWAGFDPHKRYRKMANTARKVLLVAATMFPFLFAATPAKADPITAGIAALVSLASTTVGSTLIGIALKFALSTLMQSLTQKDQKQKGTKEQMENGADKPPRLIIGTYGTPGHLLYHGSYDKNRNRYVQVIILSVLPVRGLSSKVRINGKICNLESVEDADGFRAVIEYEKNDLRYSRVKFNRGGQTVVDPFLATNFGTDPDFAWTSDMIVKGCAYLIVESIFSDSGVWSGTPEYLWTVQGIPLYDPRRDSSAGGTGTQRWNDMSTWGGPGDDNTAVQIYNIVRGIPDIDGSHLWGGRVRKQAYRMPVEYWFAAMNACDVSVEKKNGDIIKAFQTGAEITLDQQPIEVALDLASSCSGYLTEYGGTYKLFVGAPGLPVMTITDRDFYITAAREDDLFPPIQDLYNSAIATYPDPRSGWSMEPGPLYVDDDYLAADDNEPLVKDIQLPYVTDNNQVQRVVRAAVKESRVGPQHQGVLPPEAYILEPHDVIAYTSADNGYHNASFLITGKEDGDDCSQVINIRAVNPDVHIWLKAMELDHTVGKTGVIKPGALDLIFTAAPGYTETANGRDKPAIDVTWSFDDVDIDVDFVKWRVRRVGATKILANGSIHHLQDGNQQLTDAAFRFRQSLQIQFFPKPISKRESNWTAWQTVTMVDLSKPAPPVLSVQSLLNDTGRLDYYLKMECDPVGGEVGYVFEVTEVSDGNTVRRSVVDLPRRKIAVSVGDQFSVRVATKAADGGSISDFSNPTTRTITKKAANSDPATGLTATTGTASLVNRIVLKMTRSASQKDFKRYNIYVATTNDFTTASKLDDTPASRYSLDDLANAVSRFFWITTVDDWGNESAKFPASNTAGIIGTTRKLSAKPSDGDFDTTPLPAPQTVGPRAATVSFDQDNQDVNGDGSVEVAFTVSWDDVAEAAGYYVEVSIARAAGGPWTVSGKSRTTLLNKFAFSANTNLWYKVRVEALNAYNQPGDFTTRMFILGNTETFATYAGFKPAKKSSFVPIGGVGTPTAVAKPKGFMVTWPRCQDADYRETILYRFDSSAGTQEVTRFKGNAFPDHSELVLGRAYQYSIEHVDTSGNRSATSLLATAVTFRGTLDSDVDPNSPNQPAAPTLSTYTAELTGDNVVDTGLLVTMTAPTVDASHPAALSYDVEIWRSTTGINGIYSFLRRYPSPDTSFAFPCSAKYHYKACFRGRSFAHRTGPYSLLSTVGVQPLQYSATVQAATGLTVSPLPKGFKLTVPKATDPNFREVIYFANGVEIERRRGISFNDTTPRAIGDSVTYTFQYMDSQDRVGTVSGPVTVTYRGVKAIDIEAGAVDSPALAPGAVTPSKADLSDTTNMMRDPAMSDLVGWSGTAAVFQAFNAASGSSRYKLTLATSSLAGSLYSGADLAVEPGMYYVVSSYVGSDNAASAAFTLTVSWYSMDSSGALTLISDDVVGTFTGTTINLLSGMVIAPANARRAQLTVSKAATPGTNVRMAWATPIFRKAVQNTDVKASELRPDVLNPGVFGLNDVAIDVLFSLVANAQNILAEITITFDPSPQPFVNRRFMLIGHVTSVAGGGGLPTDFIRLGMDIDMGAGYAMTGSMAPIFNPTSWKPTTNGLQGIATCTFQISSPGSATSIKFAFKGWLPAGQTGALTQRHLSIITQNSGA